MTTNHLSEGSSPSRGNLFRGGVPERSIGLELGSSAPAYPGATGSNPVPSSVTITDRGQVSIARSKEVS